MIHCHIGMPVYASLSSARCRLHHRNTQGKITRLSCVFGQLINFITIAFCSCAEKILITVACRTISKCLPHSNKNCFSMVMSTYKNDANNHLRKRNSGACSINIEIMKNILVNSMYSRQEWLHAIYVMILHRDTKMNYEKLAWDFLRSKQCCQLFILTRLFLKYVWLVFCSSNYDDIFERWAECISIW